MALMDLFKKKLADSQARQAKSRTPLWAKLRTLLAEANEDAGGDDSKRADELLQLAGELHLDARHIEFYAVVVSKAQEWQALAKRRQEAAPKLAALEKEMVGLHNKMVAAIQKKNEAMEEHARLAALQGNATAAELELVQLSRQFPALLTGDESAEPAIGPLGDAIAQAAERLGIRLRRVEDDRRDRQTEESAA